MPADLAVLMADSLKGLPPADTSYRRPAYFCKVQSSRL